MPVGMHLVRTLLLRLPRQIWLLAHRRRASADWFVAHDRQVTTSDDRRDVELFIKEDGGIVFASAKVTGAVCAAIEVKNKCAWRAGKHDLLRGTTAKCPVELDLMLRQHACRFDLVLGGAGSEDGGYNFLFGFRLSKLPPFCPTLLLGGSGCGSASAVAVVPLQGPACICQVERLCAQSFQCPDEAAMEAYPVDQLDLAPIREAGLYRRRGTSAAWYRQT